MKPFIEFEELNHMGVAEASFRLSFNINYSTRTLFIKKENIVTERYQTLRNEWNKNLESPIQDISISEKEILKNWLIGLLCYPNLFFGYPSYYKSEMFSQNEFEELRNQANLIIEVRKKKSIINAKGNKIIQFCDEKNLNARPSLENINSWLANCPSKGSHNIEISTKSNTWGCGYCKISGNLIELIKFTNKSK